MIDCPALLISAPAAGQGKTTVTAAIARYYRNQGLSVRVFKTGPDFLDPMILEQASGNPVYQLDLWMGGEAHCRKLLFDAATRADLILIEGVMGLFDGEPSTANLASVFNISVLAVIDGSAMAQTFGAVALGLASYHALAKPLAGKEVKKLLAGVFANRVANVGHYQLLAESLPAEIKSYGWLPRSAEISLPERHLGLVNATEIDDLDHRIEKSANAICDICKALPPATNFQSVSTPSLMPRLAGVKIAVARDAAFSFLYRANLELLQMMGAELTVFSPLSDASLPLADALYFPGGYPELHLAQLAENSSLKQEIQHHHKANKPIVAECGGLLYLLTALTNSKGQSADMVGLVHGSATMKPRLSNIGLHSAQLPEGELRGHTFHYSVMVNNPTPTTYSVAARDHGKGEPIFCDKRLTASYMHWYFPSGPDTAARLFLP